MVVLPTVISDRQGRMAHVEYETTTRKLVAVISSAIPPEQLEDMLTDGRLPRQWCIPVEGGES